MHLSFVFPCLNEERFIGPCIEAVKSALSSKPDLQWEIVVGDNGSTDRSAEIATSLGARVVPVPERGYGAALRGGIAAAAGEYVMFADADGTYLYTDAPALYEATVKAAADMGIASRMTGKIEPGAMPTLHRYLGTPVLTGLINFFFNGKLSDCNSGFRCLKKSSFDSWGVRASGMEFASELLIKALKNNARTVEIPSGLKPSPLERAPHLRTWRDGMRHLLFILSERPSLPEKLGLLMLVVFTLLQGVGAATGPLKLAVMNIFDLHSQLLLLLGALVGVQLYVFGCMLFLRSHDKPLALTRRLIGMHEGNLFFTLLALLVALCAVVLWLVLKWAGNEFAGLNEANTLIVFLHFLCVPALASLGLLGVHVLRKAEK
jgi:hypothetical protein